MSMQDNSVTITLNDREYSLRPTIVATRRLSRMKDGFQGLFTAVVAYDFDTYAAVIKAGLEHEKHISDKDLERYVYEAGLTNLLAPVAKYVRCLQNGGRLEENESGGSNSDDEGNDRN